VGVAGRKGPLGWVAEDSVLCWLETGRGVALPIRSVNTPGLSVIIQIFHKLQTPPTEPRKTSDPWGLYRQKCIPH
jgi:hypothetical protein